MWTELGQVSLAQFFGIDKKTASAQRASGEAFMACKHLATVEESFTATRELIVRVATEVATSGDVLIVSVYGPVGYQGLPDVVATWFAMKSGEERKRYSYPAVEFAYREGYVESWFNFEADGAALNAILAEKTRIAWGGGIRVGGVQVPEDKVSTALKICPFQVATLRHLPSSVRFAFKLNNDLNELSVYLAESFLCDATQRLGIERISTREGSHLLKKKLSSAP